jgi:hypothetical protein
MPLRLYPDVRASGVVPDTWFPIRGGTIKFPVRNPRSCASCGDCVADVGRR